MPTIPMSAGTFTDSGYRFRKNSFDRNDHWIPYTSEGSHTFYDIIPFNSD